MHMCAISHCGSAKDAMIFKCMALKKTQADQKATHQEVLQVWRRLRLIPNMTANFTCFLNMLEKKLLVNQWRSE